MTIKLGLRELSIPDKIQFARQVAAKATGNPDLPDPDPTPVELTTGATALETGFNAAVASRQEAQVKTQQQNDLETALDVLLTRYAGYVESQVLGDPLKIKAAGLEVRSTSTAVGELPVPGDFTATSGDHDGEIDLSWNRVRGARSYLIEQSADGLAWKAAGVTTKSSHTVSGLNSGARVSFRVAAIGAAGQGPWSDPSGKIVP